MCGCAMRQGSASPLRTMLRTPTARKDLRGLPPLSHDHAGGAFPDGLLEEEDRPQARESPPTSSLTISAPHPMPALPSTTGSPPTPGSIRGGPMECLSLDRATGTQSNLVEAERIVSSPRNPHFQSRVTPDGHSRFRASGVLEGDCLMCHLNGYRLDRRNAQVASRNYRWAPTAGAGLGEVAGRVWSPARAKVSGNSRAGRR